jgi:hypothetical protein
MILIRVVRVIEQHGARMMIRESVGEMLSAITERLSDLTEGKVSSLRDERWPRTESKMAPRASR